MTFIARLLRFLFWVALLSWGVSLLRRLVNHMGAGQIPSHPDMDVTGGAASQKLVRDPVCGMHITASRAISISQGPLTVHFCSTECRDKYLDAKGRFAANA